MKRNNQVILKKAVQINIKKKKITQFHLNLRIVVVVIIAVVVKIVTVVAAVPMK